MITAVTNKFKDIIGQNTNVPESRKRTLEEDNSSDEDVIWVGEGEPAPKKSRPLPDTEPTIRRSYHISGNTILKGTVNKFSNLWSWMSSFISPTISLEEPRRRDTYSNDIQYIGTTRSRKLLDDPVNRAAVIRPAVSMKRDLTKLSGIDERFRFSPSLTSTVAKEPFGPTTNLLLKRRSLVKNSAITRSSLSPIKTSNLFSTTPVKRLHSTKYPLKTKSIFDFISSKFTDRGRPCIHESYRHEDKQQYKKLLQKYAEETSSYYSIPKVPSIASLHSNSRSSSPQSTISRAQLDMKWTKDASAHISSKPGPFALSSRMLNNGGYSFGKKSLSSSSSLSAPTANSEIGSHSPRDSDNDCVIVAEDIKVRSRTNSLERSMLESPIFHKDWQRDLHERFNTRAKMKMETARKIEEQHKICSEVRKQSRPSLEERIANRLRQLDLCYPSKIEEIEEEKEEEEEEEILPELTPSMNEVIDDALSNRAPGQVLVDKFNIQITRRDIATLAGLNWLNDEVINFYMNLLMERGKNDNHLDVYAFNTFFYPKLVKTGYSTVRRWTKKVNIFSHQLLLIPVHLGMHWCLATIDFRTKHVRYYDSMLGDNERCLEALVKYLESEHQDKKQSSYDTSGWTLENVKNIPQQMNGSDCGMFACKFSEYLSRDAKITFDQQHMPYFRRRMIYEIVSAKLL